MKSQNIVRAITYAVGIEARTERMQKGLDEGDLDSALWRVNQIRTLCDNVEDAIKTEKLEKGAS